MEGVEESGGRRGWKKERMEEGELRRKESEKRSKKRREKKRVETRGNERGEGK